MKRWNFCLHLPPVVIFLIGYRVMAHRWGIELGFWRHDHAEPGEICWRWWRSWSVPHVALVFGPIVEAPPGHCDPVPSAAWTGRTRELLWIEIGHRTRIFL